MSILRHSLTSLSFLVVSASCVPAQDQPAAQSPPDTESFETVKKEFQSARDEYVKALEAALDVARKNGKLENFKFDKQAPRILFSPRFLAIAEKNPEGPEAIDALKMTLQTSFATSIVTPRSKRGPRPSRSCGTIMPPSRRSRAFSHC